tara:strand:- start:1038 stop:1976 length:939 start_codon:yes stop_codon:yes gene_type:complete
MTAGSSYSATSPLAYTLQYNSKYVSGGCIKEGGQFLYCIEKFNRLLGPKGYELSINLFQNRIKQRKKLKNFVSLTLEDVSRRYHRIDQSEGHRVCVDHYVPNLDKIWVEPYTIDQYIEYLYALWDVVKKLGYKGVADFGNSKRWCSEEFWVENADKIKEHFDVKVGLIVRDPIRRSWSCNYSKHNGELHEIFHKNDWAFNYLPVYDRFKKFFDTHLIVMEELWEDDGTEKKKLEQFIDYKLGDLHRNIYAPDRGHLLDEFDLNLKDQCEKLPELPPELYMSIREGLYAPIYQAWEDRFGKLPLYWGSPLEYK